MQLKGWSICSGFGWSVCRGFAWSAWREFRWSVSADFPIGEQDPDYFDDASYANSGLSAINELESNHKLINDIYLNTLLAGVDTFTEEQMEDLETIAQMCFADGGAAVYQAMALLSYAYKTPIVYDCEEPELKQTEVVSKDNFLLAALYPNPTTGLIVIENYCLDEPIIAEVRNVFGTQILNTNIPAGPAQTIISLSDQPAGFYTIHLKGCNSQMQKVIVKIQ